MSQGRLRLKRDLQRRVRIRRDRQYWQQRSPEVHHADEEVAAASDVSPLGVAQSPAADDGLLCRKRRQRRVLGLLFCIHDFAFTTCWQNWADGFHDADYLKSSSYPSG